MKKIFTLFLCSFVLTYSAQKVLSQNLETDSLALVDLYNDCGGTEWVGFDTWLNGPLNTWELVTVDSATQRVTGVEFKDMHLVGTLPASLGNLDKMSGKIEFRDDSLLTGALPSFLWNWTEVDRFQIKFSGYTSIDTDGLENMVNLTEFNTEGSPIEGMIPGVLFTLPSMVKLYFHDSEFDALPPELLQSTGLDRLYLNGDNFTDLPDMSGIQWKSGAKVRVQDNFLTFEDLEANMPLTADANVDEFRYSPQANVGEDATLFPDAGSSVNLVATVGGSANVYNWIKGEEQVGDTDTFTIDSFDPSTDSGEYFAVVQSTLVPGLDILTGTTTIYSSRLVVDSLALVDLYNDCGGTEWVGFDTWLNGPLNTWERVTVDSATQRVTNVEFKDMHLVGSLPASLGNLDKMSGKIEFRDDSLLTGALPSFLWNWTDVDRFQIKFSGYTSIDTDGLENMVNLTEFNTEGSPIEGMIPGVLFTLPSMVKLYFHDSEFDALPPELLQSTGLDRLYLNGDNFTDLPDMSGIQWKAGAKVRVQDNFLTFEDLEANMPLTADANVDEFRYSPQANVGEDATLFPDAGSSVNLVATVGGTANVYNWIKGEEQVGDTDTFTIDSFDPSTDSGEYFAVVQSTLVPGLDILTGTTTIYSSRLVVDSLALVDLYNDCGGTEWVGFDTWLNGPLNTWERVTVDSATQRVTNVEFKDMHLVGTLPSSLGNLDKMSGKIEFRDDSLLTGALPSFLWNWTDVDRFQIKFSGYTSIDTDGLENMVNLTEFNTEGSPIEGMIPGVLFTLPSMVKLYFHDSEFDALPPELLQSTGLDRLYLNGDNFTDLPDMSGIQWKAGAKVRVQDNFLTFEDLEANMPLTADANVDEFRYSPQANVGEDATLFPDAGSSVNLVATVGGTANVYNWIKGEEQVGDTDTFTIDSFDPSTDSGEYFAVVQSTLVPGLDILTGTTTIYSSRLVVDSLALVDLYNDCGGTEWVGFDTWLNGPLNTWELVTVDSATQRVTNVEFKDMHLVGTLPSSLGNLDKMSGKIEFRDDSLLTGALPSFLWNWTDVDRFQIKFSGYTSIDTDGLENMVNLTEFNTEGSPIEGMIPGVLFTLPSMVKLYFHDSEFDALPPELLQSTGLDRLYLNGDNFTDLPDMSGIQWKAGAKVRVQDNFLTFEDLEANMPLTADANVDEFRYSPQANVGEDATLFPDAGSSVNLVATVGGTANVYNWIKGEEQVGDTDTFTIDSFDPSTDSGEYFAVVQSTLVPGLDILTGTTTIYSSRLVVDSLALVDLYNDCGGTEWVGFDTWLNGPLNTWELVTVDSATQRVTNVEFKDMHLVGSLPASLGNLDKMSGKIEFRDDSLLTGALPSFLWNWTDVDRFQIKFSGYTSIDTDGLENMVNLTEFNTEGSPIEGMIPGVLFTLPSMVKLYFHDSEFDALPPELLQSTGLDRLYLNGDNFTDLPDMSGIQWKSGAKVRVQDNFLTFEDLEANMPLTADANVDEFRYSPQANVGEDATLFPDAGSSVNLVATVGGSANVYNWIKGEEQVGDTDTFTIDSFDPSTDSGEYFAVVQSTLVPGLDILTGTTTIYSSRLVVDSLALVDLYNDCGGTEWVGFDTWLNGPLNTWERVTVDSATQRVTNVEFKDMHLVGSLPASLGNLDKMSGKIEFRDDSLLTGALPSFLWNWTDVDRFQIKFSGYTSIDTDGLENMVNLTEFNTEGSPMEGMIPGVLFTLPSMVKLYFHDSEFDALPPELLQSTGLDRLYLNGDNFTDLPDMSGIQWKAGAKVRVQDNFLTFEDLEANMPLTADANVDEFRYSPQANVGEDQTLYPATGSEVNLIANVGGSANIYTWIKGEDQVGDSDTFTIASFDPSSDAGEYFAVVQSTLVPGLDILTGTTGLFGSLLTIDSLALVDLYNDCGGTEWVGFDTWLNGPLNTWERVTVDSATQRVTNVEFKDMHLVGTLPSSLGNLDKMSGKIEFRDDSLLTGALPSFLWNWTDVDRFQIKFSGYTSIDTDGLENMVNLTEFNTEGSPMEGMIPGVLFTLPSMVKLYFHDSEFDALPPEFTQVSGLDRLYLNGDNFTDLPDMTGIAWADGAKIRVHSNFLTFEDLETNVVLLQDTLVEEFSYSPQADIGVADSIVLNIGDTLMLSINIGGTANTYTWIKGEDMVIDGAAEMVYKNDSVTMEDAGDYRALVQNTLVPGLDIFRAITTVTINNSTGLEEIPFTGLRVMGNPFGDKISIYSDETIENLYLYDLNGQLLMRNIINNNNVEIDATGLNAGIYIVLISNNQKFQTIKMVKK